PIDRILLPKDRFLAEEQELIEEMEAAAQEAAVENALDQLDQRQQQQTDTPGGVRPGGSSPGGDRPDQNADPAQTLGGGR
ncbi:MAG: hypothetical protein ACYTGG_13030, partial [Planctomycetota bacterium]